MKISAKILIGFFIIFVFGFAQLLTTYKTQKGIIKSINLIEDVQNPLEKIPQQILGDDSMLTEQTRVTLLHVQKGEFYDLAEHKAKYDEALADLNDLLKIKSKILLNLSGRSPEIKKEVNDYINSLNEFRANLIDREAKAFDAMDKKETEAAFSMIMGGDYLKNKNEFYIKSRNWMDLEYKLASDERNNILKGSEKVMYLDFFVTIVVIVAMMAVMFLLRSFVFQIMRAEKFKQRQ